MKISCICAQCGKPVEKIPSQVKKTINHFCSHSCAATYNNKKYIKRPSSAGKCICGGRKTGTAQQCQKCRTSTDRVAYGLKTIQEVLSNNQLHARFNAVRAHGRLVLRWSGRPQICALCKFSAVLEACHITPIVQFPMATPLNVVNNETNLAYLCPNHHALFDKNLLSPRQVKKIRVPLARIELASPA